MAILVQMKLISLITYHEGNLNEIRFRCEVDLQYVETIAQQLNLRIKRYLYQE